MKIRLIDLGQKVIHHNHNSFLFCEDFSLSQFSKVHSAREEGEGKKSYFDLNSGLNEFSKWL